MTASSFWLACALRKPKASSSPATAWTLCTTHARGYALVFSYTRVSPSRPTNRSAGTVARSAPRRTMRTRERVEHRVVLETGGVRPRESVGRVRRDEVHVAPVPLDIQPVEHADVLQSESACGVRIQLAVEPEDPRMWLGCERVRASAIHLVSGMAPLSSHR